MIDKRADWDWTQSNSRLAKQHKISRQMVWEIRRKLKRPPPSKPISLSDRAKRADLPRGVLYSRLKSGWTLDEALSVPVKRSQGIYDMIRKRVTDHQWQTMTNAQIASALGLKSYNAKEYVGFVRRRSNKPQCKAPTSVPKWNWYSVDWSADRQTVISKLRCSSNAYTKWRARLLKELDVKQSLKGIDADRKQIGTRLNELIRERGLLT
jgi:hypothetical protein